MQSNSYKQNIINDVAQSDIKTENNHPFVNNVPLILDNRILNRPPERSSNMSHNDSMLMWNMNNYEIDIDEGLTSTKQLYHIFILLHFTSILHLFLINPEISIQQKHRLQQSHKQTKCRDCNQRRNRRRNTAKRT